MKRFRLLIGIAIALFGLWVIVGEQMAGASADAVVNAPVVTLRSTTSGVLDLPARDFGSRVEQGEKVASISDKIVDRIRLNDLLLEVDLARAETARTAADLDATRALRDELLSRSTIFHEERLAELRTRLDHARARLAILEGGAVPDRDGQRLLDAVEGTPETSLPAEPRIEALVLDHARERVEVLEIALRAAQSGVFLGDGYNDSPNAEQRAVELSTVISNLESQLAENRAHEEAYARRVTREQVRVNDLIGGEIASPVSGQFWEILQADGVTVQRGDPILRILDCNATMVTLSVTERVYNSLRVGDPATFRLSGASGVHDATVARLAGSGAATIYEHLAVAPSLKHLERYDVTLDVPALRPDSVDGCLVGHTGRAFFDRRPLDLLRSWFD
ncbi:HlyD family efflux transporter periplasmic adaptor subunit [Salipiger sp.]|uniref:HlyD family efflux transporter periplasmic adaptor subunit n=1 Tax=Salipiger sp. TaxID=2078585 RepID=UPI003A9822B2